MNRQKSRDANVEKNRHSFKMCRWKATTFLHVLVAESSMLKKIEKSEIEREASWEWKTLMESW